MAKVAYQEAGNTVADLLARIGGIMDFTVSDASSDSSAKVFEAITAAGQAACTWDGAPWDWMLDTALFQTRTLTVDTAANSGAARASNVSTIKTTANNLLRAGQTVKITSCSDSTFDGTWKVASAATTSLTFVQVADDVGAATAGTGTVHVCSYPLRVTGLTGGVTSTDSEKVLWDIHAIQRIYYDDDRRLAILTWPRYRHHQRVLKTQAAGEPLSYALHQEPVASGSGSEPILYLWPAPDDAYDLWIDYFKRHSKITGGTTGSEDFALIVPAEYQFGIYVEGALWLLRHEIGDVSSLRDCKPFVEAIGRMVSSAGKEYSGEYPEDMFSDAVAGHWPHDRRVLAGLIENTPSL